MNLIFKNNQVFDINEFARFSLATSVQNHWKGVVYKGKMVLHVISKDLIDYPVGNLERGVGKEVIGVLVDEKLRSKLLFSSSEYLEFINMRDFDTEELLFEADDLILIERGRL
ncbi:MAG: hypothetical protein LBV67_02720 [Streptococcaceae bacterium]|jgi:hypothetical protein|nr:hypothetical protein [Streptococcaceae bacterium]